MTVTCTCPVATAAAAYVHTRDEHQTRGPLLSTLAAAHQALVDAVHDTTPAADHAAPLPGQEALL